jgi:hypothetical protein
MANLPQVIVTLAPNGTLIAELPGPNGARRQVPLGPQPGPTLLRILQNQLSNRTEIGLDGAPTQAQVKHWERHEIWADPTCRFCIAERGLHPRQKPKASRKSLWSCRSPTASKSGGLAISNAKPSSSGPARPSRARPRPSRWPSWNHSSGASGYEQKR